MASIRRWGVAGGGAVAGLIQIVGAAGLGYFAILPELASGPFEATTPDVVTPLVAQFLSGFVLVWVYVGFRPRFGAGRRSIFAASIAVWAAMSIALLSVTALFPVLSPLTVALAVVWFLIQSSVAGFAGAGLYRRHAAAAARKRGRPVDVVPT